MKRYTLIAIGLVTLGTWMASDLWGRGGRAGGGGGARTGGGGGARGGALRGGGGARPGAGRTPSMSRPQPRPSTRPSTNRPSGGRAAGAGSRPGGNTRPAYGNLPTPRARPGAGASNRPGAGTGNRTDRIANVPSANRPGASTRPGGSTLPDIAARPGAGRPSSGDLQNFLDLPGAGAAARPRTGPATRPGGGNVLASGAASEFLRERPVSNRPGADTRPARTDLAGNHPANRPADIGRPGRPQNLPADIGRAGRPSELPADVGRPGRPNGNWAHHRPDRIDNRDQWNNWRQNNHNEITNHWHNHWNDHDHWFDNNWWRDHPNIDVDYDPGFNHWGAAAWPAVIGWVGYGWNTPVNYNYGENVYYQDNSVYYGDQPVATSEEYAQQAEAIATSIPETKSAEEDWMPLGVFAIAPDGEPTGAEPTLYLQLAVSKQGILSGTLQNTATESAQPVEGMVDKQTQRAAWTVADKMRPLMETGMVNLTKDTAPALVHFADGTTQQWLLVRLDKPASDNASPSR
jgi:hypothetical protein